MCWGDITFAAHEHSYQIWLELPEPWRAEAFRDQAARKGVYFLSGDAFVVGRQQAPHAIRICVGSCRTREEVQEGVENYSGSIKRDRQAAAPLSLNSHPPNSRTVTA